MRSRSPTPVVLWGFWCGGCLLLLLDRGQGAESYKFRSSRQRAPPHYEGRYSAELANLCLGLSDVQKRQYQAGFEDWSTYLQPKVVGSSNVVTIDPATGEATAAVVPDILTVAAQRSLAAAEYNELVSQCRMMSGHPRYRAKVRSQRGFDEMAHGGNPLYSGGDDRERHIYPAAPAAVAPPP
mmetsp:Transcript_41694/g.66949  ORF Transcript_41694/g.66949 Transcript_41694/m.66949 type:complete len:182 (+) Transcript_41694:41-586(+)